jgi:class 3 adenylate cyclase
VLKARPHAISLEGANPRHEHEWAVFRDVKLPDDKVLIPGVLDSDHQLHRAPRAGGAAHRALRRGGRRERVDRRQRLRLRHLRALHAPGGAGDRVGEAWPPWPRARAWRRRCSGGWRDLSRLRPTRNPTTRASAAVAARAWSWCAPPARRRTRAPTRFCHKCGGALDAAESPSPRSYTPKHLADKILTAGSALQGERKQVTVLFVDVSGFTSLSERLDPEEVHRLMNRAFDLMLAEVHRYEGTVNQFLGDGIMALSARPSPTRTTRAAPCTPRSASPRARGLPARAGRARHQLPRAAGLNTGLVVVGSIGGDLRMDYTAVGDTTNVAARLQQASEPGRVTISEAPSG